MGYETKVQEIRRPDYTQYFINFPRVIIKAMNFKKGEVFEWEIVDRDTLILRRKEGSKGARDAG
ncbi:MAG: hypothetical protein M1371_10330 [Actinobacteria bacterium]|nr:hypothetical protein [Actinomycetota bacterium]